MMTEVMETEAINQALRIIDASLGTMSTRELVSSAEVTDLLLDMRSLLTGPELEADVTLEELEPAVN
jgi:hypothetical protein